MTKSEIIRQAKHYFGKDRTVIRDLVLSYVFDGKQHEQWESEIKRIIPNAFDVSFGIFDDVVEWLKEGKSDKIDWNWIGDLSWSIEIVLNPLVDKGYDWDKKLAQKCNGTVRILRIFVSDVVPCYTYDPYFMTYNKTGNYYEFGPLYKLTKDENTLLKKVMNYLENKGLTFLETAFCSKKFKGLYSDLNSEGGATLFDVLFSDTHTYQTEIKRFSDREIVEKSGTKFRWTEYYSKKGSLIERIESRWTKAGDYLKVILDNKGQIKFVEVWRNKIGRKKKSKV